MKRHLIGSIAFPLLLSPFARAQFGGVVFDPTQSAHAIQQTANQIKGIAQDSQRNLTLLQSLAQDEQIAGTALKQYTTLMAQYNTIVNNLRYFNTKSIWRTAETALMASSVSNSYGETSGLQSTLNGNTPGTASTVWKLMTIGLNGTSSGYWSNQVIGASSALSTLANIEAIDAASAQCLGAVGQYNQTRNTNMPTVTALQTTTFDAQPQTNSELQQFNLMNIGQSEHVTEARAQGNLHACMAAQAAVANMQQRNAASAALNNASFKLSQQSANPTYAGKESQTWTTYY